MYSYLQSSLPLSLVEAARIDGSGEFRTFNSIVLPIMKPAVAVQAIFTFVGSWNNYFVPALIIQSKSKMTVPILIATLRGADYMNFDMGKIYMMITVAIVPIIIVYLLLSHYCRCNTWWCKRIMRIKTPHREHAMEVLFMRIIILKTGV